VTCSGPALPDLTSPKAREWGRGNEGDEHPGDLFPLRVPGTRRSLVFPGPRGLRSTEVNHWGGSGETHSSWVSPMREHVV